MADFNPEFGDAVREVLGARGYRQVAARAGISATYVGDMVRGRVVRRPVILAFASACGADAATTNRLLRLAGYVPLEPGEGAAGEGAAPGAEGPTPAQVVGMGLQELARKYDVPNLTVRNFGGMRDMTLADAERLLREIEADILRELEEERREAGG
jgi:hypothetical protein